MTIDICARTEIGKIRSANEDAFYVDPDKGIFLVADGLGGHPAGNVASRMVVEEAVRFLGGKSRVLEGKVAVGQAIKKANEAVYNESIKTPQVSGMGTTVVLAVLRGEFLYLANVGDSRAYLYSDRGLRQLTRDHTITFQLYEQGKIRKETIPFHPYHGVLLRSVGLERTVEVDTYEVHYKKGEYVILCTDGLTDLVQDREIEQILMRYPGLEEACDAMTTLAMERGGTDNITIIVIRERDS
jgi:PPM family protein phosphatase